MQRCCRPGGKVLLLEHGRSSWDWLNDILDAQAPDHAQKWGCVWNRDIKGLVAQSGLKVDSISTFHFGTTYLIVASPAEAQQSAGRGGVVATSAAPSDAPPQERSRAGSLVVSVGNQLLSDVPCTCGR